MPWISGPKKRGPWRVMWREGGRTSPIRASQTYHSRVDAEAFRRDVDAMLAERRRLGGAALPSTPIDDLLKRWKVSRLAAGRVREAYADEAVGHVTAMAEEMEWTRLSDVTTDAVDRWRSKRPGGRGTDKPIQCLKGWLNWCRRTLRLAVDDGVLLIEKRRTPATRKAALLTEPQVAAILGTALRVGNASVATALEHIALYGCRPIDVCRLEVRDWNPTARTITYRQTKNLDDITHPVHAAHGAKLTALCADRGPEEPLFLDPWSRPWRITAGKAEGMSSWYAANIGQHVAGLTKEQRGIYCLKRFALTRMMAATGNRQAVATVSGHRSLQVLDRYLTTNEQTQAEVVGAVGEIELAETVDARARRVRAPG